MDAIGLDDFRPWSPQGAPYRAEAAPTRPPSSEEEAPLRRLLRDCCVAMGKQEADAQRFWTRLQAEWLESPQQMRLLPKAAWQRLALPVGLEAELQRRLECTVKDQKLKQLDLSAQRRRQSPAVRKTAGPQGPRGPRPAATPATPATSIGALRQVLRSHCGDAWAAQLLSQLRKERREGVDANALQSALRSLGVPSYSQAAVSHAVRHAGRDARGLPSGDEVVAAIHGSLAGARARMVDEVFFDLGGDIHGTLPRQMLKRRMATLELPAVKAGFSAEEALRSFTRHWGFQEVDRQSFSEAHVLLSALHRGEDDAFNHLLRRLWRLPKTMGEDVRDSPVPRLVSKKTEGRVSERPDSDRAPRANILEQERAPEDRSHRIANIEDAIQSSSRATELLERIRSALRSRGPDAVKLLNRRFQQEKGRGLGPKELRQALAEVGIGAQEEDVAELLRGMDVDGSGTVDLEEWLRVLRGPLSPARAAVVREVFQSLRRADGLVDARTLRARFSASKHPDVEAGLKDAKEVYQEVMTQITSRSDRISLSDFAKYYEHLSAGIQDDKYFSHILRRSWGLATTPGNIMARNAHRMYEGHIRSTEGGLCGL